MRLNPDRTRAEILEAAVQLFAKQGFSLTDIRGIARAAMREALIGIVIRFRHLAIVKNQFSIDLPIDPETVLLALEAALVGFLTPAVRISRLADAGALFSSAAQDLAESLKDFKARQKEGRRELRQELQAMLKLLDDEDEEEA